MKLAVSRLAIQETNATQAKISQLQVSVLINK
jgi:hypothetical protein